MHTIHLARAMLCALGLAAGSGAGAVGIDSSFGSAGTTSTNISFAPLGPAAMLRQADGRLLVAVNRTRTTSLASRILRFTPEGSPDPSFASSGEVGLGAFGAYGLAQEADGSLVVVGSKTPSGGTSPVIALQRRAPGGELIAERLYPQLVGRANGVAVQSDGKLVLAIETDGHLALRLTPALEIDTAFGTAGLVAAAGAGDDTLRGGQRVALQADGKILIGGHGTDAAVGRLLADGSFDHGYGMNGIRGIGLLTEAVSQLAQQPDGKLLVAVQRRNQPGFQITRLQANGHLDTGFGGGGTVITSVLLTSYATNLLLQDDGKITVGGFASDEARQPHFALARHLTDGAPDESFGPGGVFTHPVANLDDVSAAVLQPSGRVVLSGSTFDPNTSFGNLLVSRFSVDGAADVALGSSASGDTVKSGAHLTYTHTVHNYGPDSAYDVVLSNTLPPGTVFASATTSQGSCQTPPVGGTGTLTCRLGKVFRDANAPATLRVRVTERGGSTLANTASVSASGADGNTANNSTTLRTRVSGSRK